jgi:hypothetical protein
LGPQNDPLNVSTPEFERLLAFRKKIMTLIHSRNPGNRPILVIKDFISYVGRNTQPCHSGYAGPPQIMKPPTGDARQSVKLSLGNAEVLEGSGSGARKDELAGLIGSAENGYGLIRQVDLMHFGILRSF